MNRHPTGHHQIEDDLSFSDLLYPFEWIVAWILFGWHQLFTCLGIPSESGVAWALSIVGLVVVDAGRDDPAVRQADPRSRRMQLIQPEMQKIQAKYKDKSDPDSRQAMTQETMDLYKRTGTNPFTSCLPILLQSPFFFGAVPGAQQPAEVATGAHRPDRPDHAAKSPRSRPRSRRSSVRSCRDVPRRRRTSTSRSSRPSSSSSCRPVDVHHAAPADAKNMPAAALDNPYAKQQKMLLYLMPIFFAISGVNFPIGVLLYWLTTNVWSMGQQFYVIRRMPAPGSAAEKACRNGAARRASRSRSSPSRASTRLDEVEAPKPDAASGCSPREQEEEGCRGQRREARSRLAGQAEAGARLHHRPQAPDRQLRVTTMTEHNDTVVDDTTDAIDRAR